MIDHQFLDRFNAVSSDKQSRINAGKWILQDRSAINKILNVKEQDTSILIKLLWGLDKAVEMNPECLADFVDPYTSQLQIDTHRTIVRTLSRINYNFLNWVYSENNTDFGLKDEHKNRFIEFSFQTLMKDNSIAGSAFAMSALCYFAHEKSWVKDELLHYIQHNYSHASKGFQARARIILKDLK